MSKWENDIARDILDDLAAQPCDPERLRVFIERWRVCLDFPGESDDACAACETGVCSRHVPVPMRDGVAVKPTSDDPDALGLHHDRIHRDVGVSRAAHPARHTPTPAPPMVPDGPGLVPDRPGWWWTQAFTYDGVFPVHVERIGGHLVIDDAYHSRVEDDGNWRGPCHTAADLATARAEEREGCGDRLDELAEAAEQPGNTGKVWSSALRRLAAEIRGAT